MWLGLTACGAAGPAHRARPTRPPSHAARHAGSEAAERPAAAEPPAPASAPDDWRAAYGGRPALESMEGEVSYYSDALSGRPTASGTPYDPRAFSAASRTLPFGTVLRVQRPDTGAAVIVRVNDRGPFGRRGRILDLSRAAAEALGMIARGVLRVRVEVLEFGPRRH